MSDEGDDEEGVSDEVMIQEDDEGAIDSEAEGSASIRSRGIRHRLKEGNNIL